MISEGRLIKILRIKFQGQRLSVKSLSKEIGHDFKELYPTTLKLKNLGIISLHEINEIGRESPLDVIITRFAPPKKESILKHPLMVYVVYPLMVIFIVWIVGIFWHNAQPSGKVDQVQHISTLNQQPAAISMENVTSSNNGGDGIRIDGDVNVNMDNVKTEYNGGQGINIIKPSEKINSK